MKIVLLLSLWLFPLLWANSVMAQQEEDCIYAVDVDDEDMSSYTLCNSDSGINKILKSIVKGGDEGSTASEAFKAKVVAVNKTKAATVNKTGIAEPETHWLNDADSLSKRRFELLQAIATECKSGFEVRSERYTVGPNQGLGLEFSYLCKS